MELVLTPATQHAGPICERTRAPHAACHVGGGHVRTPAACCAAAPPRAVPDRRQLAASLGAGADWRQLAHLGVEAAPGDGVVGIQVSAAADGSDGMALCSAQPVHLAQCGPSSWLGAAINRWHAARAGNKGSGQRGGGPRTPLYPPDRGSCLQSLYLIRAAIVCR